MKLSVSLPDGDVEFLDNYARTQGYPSRSAALHHAVTLLRSGQLTAAYEEAWAAWDTTGDADAWDGTVADGLER
jgi:Arc/MetJ-type ribon-helix-helix transcriptional regulator